MHLTDSTVLHTMYYMETMLTVRLDKQLVETLNTSVITQKKTRSQVVREALNSYLSQGVSPLSKMARIAKENRYEAPKDIVENFNFYLYGKR